MQTLEYLFIFKVKTIRLVSIFFFQTIDNFPGAIFLLAGFKNIAIVVIFVIIFMKRSNFELIQPNIQEVISDQTMENIKVKTVIDKK